MKTTLIRLSVCQCGFPALNESIKLGKSYDIDPDRTADLIWICGGCKTKQDVVGVFVHARVPGQREGYLPLQLFDLSKDTMTVSECIFPSRSSTEARRVRLPTKRHLESRRRPKSRSCPDGHAGREIIKLDSL